MKTLVKNELVSLVEGFVEEMPNLKHYRVRVEAYDVNEFAVIIRFERIFHQDDLFRLFDFIKDNNLQVFIGVGFIDMQ